MTLNAPERRHKWIAGNSTCAHCGLSRGEAAAIGELDYCREAPLPPDDIKALVDGLRGIHDAWGGLLGRAADALGRQDTQEMWHEMQASSAELQDCLPPLQYHEARRRVFAAALKTFRSFAASPNPPSEGGAK